LLKQSEYLRKFNERYFALTNRGKLYYFHNQKEFDEFLHTAFCHKPTLKHWLETHSNGYCRIRAKKVRLTKNDESLRSPIRSKTGSSSNLTTPRNVEENNFRVHNKDNENKKDMTVINDNSFYTFSIERIGSEDGNDGPATLFTLRLPENGSREEYENWVNAISFHLMPKVRSPSKQQRTPTNSITSFQDYTPTNTTMTALTHTPIDTATTPSTEMNHNNVFSPQTPNPNFETQFTYYKHESVSTPTTFKSSDELHMPTNQSDSAPKSTQNTKNLREDETFASEENENENENKSESEDEKESKKKNVENENQEKDLTKGNGIMKKKNNNNDIKKEGRKEDVTLTQWDIFIWVIIGLLVGVTLYHMLYEEL